MVNLEKDIYTIQEFFKKDLDKTNANLAELIVSYSDKTHTRHELELDVIKTIDSIKDEWSLKLHKAEQHQLIPEPEHNHFRNTAIYTYDDIPVESIVCVKKLLAEKYPDVALAFEFQSMLVITAAIKSNETNDIFLSNIAVVLTPKEGSFIGNKEIINVSLMFSKIVDIDYGMGGFSV